MLRRPSFRATAQLVKVPANGSNTVSPGLLLALMMRLLDRTLIRVGNVEYARNNQSFGLTTLHTNHLEVNGAKLRFEFNSAREVLKKTSVYVKLYEQPALDNEAKVWEARRICFGSAAESGEPGKGRDEG